MKEKHKISGRMSRSSSRSNSKKSKTETWTINNVVDLPDEIIHHIASFLDFKSIYQASLVSKKWKFLIYDNYLSQASFPFVNFSFAKFPRFDYKLADRYNYDTGKTEKRKDYDFDSYFYRNEVLCSFDFIRFEERVLTQRYNSSSSFIQKFCFSSQNFDEDRLNYYVKSAISLHVQEISLSLSMSINESSSELCSRLLTCKSVRVLELRGGSSGYFSIHLPETVDLPNLKHLHLESVSFSEGLFPLSSCPLLETLVLKFCSFDSKVNSIDISSLSLHSLVLQTLIDGTPAGNLKINISAPNLMYFKLSDGIEKICCVENLIAPAKADLDISMVGGYCMELDISRTRRGTYAKRLINYLQALKKVQSLTLGTCFLRIISEARGVLQQHPVNLYNLRCLKLKLWLYQNCVPAMVYLLQNAPNLETLVFETRLHRYWSGLKVRVLLWYEDSFDSAIMEDGWEAELLRHESLLNCLKTVEISDFLGCEEEIRFLKFLLKNSKVLEKVTLVASEECHLHDVKKMTTKISETLWTFPRASSSISISLS